MPDQIKATKLLKSGWDFFSSNINKLWTVALLLSLPSIIAAFSRGDEVEYDPEQYGSFSEFTESAFGVSAGQFGLMALLFLAISVIYMSVVYGGSLKLLLQSLKGKVSDFKLGEIVNVGFKHLGKVVVLFVTVGLIVFIGFALLIVPGVIAAFFLSLALHFTIDKGLGVADSISASYKTIKNNLSPVLAVYFGLIVVGAAVAIVTSTLFSADVWLVRVLAAVAESLFGLFSLVVITKLYLKLGAKPAREAAKSDES